MNGVSKVLMLSICMAAHTAHAINVYPATREGLKKIKVQVPVASGFFSTTISLQDKTAYDLIGSTAFSKTPPDYWQTGDTNIRENTLVLVPNAKGKYIYGLVRKTMGSINSKNVYYYVQTSRDATEEDIKEYNQNQVAVFIPAKFAPTTK